MNCVNISGNLGSAPELKQTQSGKSVTSFNVAVKRPFSKDVTDWLTVVCWNQSAEYVCKYGDKGSHIEVTGTIQSRSYTDKNDQKRTAFEIVADSIRIINSKQKEQREDSGAPAHSSETFAQIEDDGDLPF